MALQIRIPKLGLTMLDAVLVRWMVETGQPVTLEQSLCVIETDKVTYEVPSPGDGLLLPVIAPGRRMAVGGLIGYVAEDDTELAGLIKQHGTVDTAKEKPIVQSDEAYGPERKAETGALRKPAGRIKASPAARRWCKAHGIELGTLPGTGPEGRVILADVKQVMEENASETTGSVYEIKEAPEGPDVLTAAEEIPIRGIRKRIFQNMHVSLTRQAQLTLHTETSVHAMTALRRRLNDRMKPDAVPVSYNAVIVRAAARALRDHPRLNASVDGRKIKLWKQIHIGVAMDFGEGLLVPKIRHADRKSIREISAEIQDVARRIKEKKLLPDELLHGTFTVTNLGAWKTDHFTPIVNFPESAILGVGRIVEKPWVRDHAVVAEERMALSLTFDHRVIDGAVAAAFLKTVKDMIEEPGLML